MSKLLRVKYSNICTIQESKQIYYSTLNMSLGKYTGEICLVHLGLNILYKNVAGCLELFCLLIHKGNIGFGLELRIKAALGHRS